MLAAPGQALATTGTGPRRRSALMTFLMPIVVIVAGVVASAVLAMILAPLALLGTAIATAGVLWSLLQIIVMANEVKSVTRNDAFAWWPILIPLYGFYWMWILLPAEVGKAKQVLGVQQPPRSIVLYIFLPVFALASDVNDLVR
jgi:hypothetical protein